MTLAMTQKALRVATDGTAGLGRFGNTSAR
jgi:hypothetical protein